MISEHKRGNPRVSFTYFNSLWQDWTQDDPTDKHSLHHKTHITNVNQANDCEWVSYLYSKHTSHDYLNGTAYICTGSFLWTSVRIDTESQSCLSSQNIKYKTPGSGNGSVVRAQDSWSKGLGFEFLQERRENFLRLGQHYVPTHLGIHAFHRRVTAEYVKDPGHSARSAGGRLQLQHACTLRMCHGIKWHCEHVRAWMV